MTKRELRWKKIMERRQAAREARRIRKATDRATVVNRYNDDFFRKGA